MDNKQIEKEKVSCCICGGDNCRVILRNLSSGDLVLCKTCQLYYINPRRKDHIIYSNSSAITRQGLWKFKIDEARWRVMNFRKRLSMLKEFCEGPGRLLDVGCYEGFFLGEVREQGWETWGVEARVEAAEFAKKELELNVIVSTFEEAELPSGYFDVVTMFHFLEHVSDPLKVLTKAHQVLKPSGVLVIEVPNIGTIWFKILGRKWRHFSPDHYYFFTRESLNKLLAKAGFEMLKADTVGKSMSARYFAGLLRTYGVFLSDAVGWLVRKLGLADKTVTINPGDIIICFSRKVET